MKIICLVVVLVIGVTAVTAEEFKEDSRDVVPETKQSSIFTVTRQPTTQTVTYTRNADGTCSRVTLLGYNMYNQPVYRVENLNTGGSTLVSYNQYGTAGTYIERQGTASNGVYYTCGNTAPAPAPVATTTRAPVPVDQPTTTAAPVGPSEPAPAPQVISTVPATCTTINSTNLFTVTTPVANQPVNPVTNPDGTTSQRQLIGYNCLGQPVYQDTNANGTTSLVTTDGTGRQAYQNSTGYDTYLRYGQKI